MPSNGWTYEIFDVIKGHVIARVELDDVDRTLSPARQKAEAVHVALEKRMSLIGANLNGISADEADFSHVNLIGAALHDATLRRANLNGVNFCGADLSRVDFTEASLIGARFCGVQMAEARLCGADLRGANLSGAVMMNADLTAAELNGAMLHGALCTGAIFDRCDLASMASFGADMNHARFNGAHWRNIPLKRRPIRVSGLDYNVTLLDEHIVVGATILTLSDLARLDEREAAARGGVRALRFIRNFKDVIESLFACKDLVRDVPKVVV